MLFLLSCFGEPDIPPPQKPDILLVVIDTARADGFQSYGNERPVGTHFAKIASEGTLFTQAWSPAPWTWPSHASLFTGLYPWEHGAHFSPPVEGAIPMKPDPFYATDLRADLPTLAERLKQAGYQTASFSGNRLIGPNFNMVRGFETAEFLDDDSKVIRRAQEYLTQRDSKPLFLFINLMSAHTPWFRNPIDWVMQHAESLTPETAPDWVRPHLLPKGIGLHPFHPYMKESLVFHYISGKKDIPESGFTLIRDLYDGELRRSDEHLGMLLSSWPAQNSVVAVTSDHGEYLGEHRLLEHGRTLYPEVLHVPLAIKAPNLPTKRVVDTPVPMHWLHDEILMQAGIPAENSLFNPPAAVYAAAYIDDYWAKHLGHPFDKGYRLKRENEVIHLMDSQYTCTRYILKERYLLDPSSDNCADSTKEELAKLFSQSQSGATVQPDIETLEMLKKLGYVGENE